jgi:Polyketide cyclase / dehydrase and lipid transport
MARVSGDILIERPVEEVFDFVADQRNEPTYNPQMLRSEKITDGPIGVGTRFRATARSRGRAAEMLIEVTEFQRPRRLGSRTTMSDVDVDGGLTFESVAGATRMNWSREVTPKGTTAAARPARRPPWASPGTHDLDRAQGPARGIWRRSRFDRTVITEPGQSPASEMIMSTSRRLEAGVGAA